MLGVPSNFGSDCRSGIDLRSLCGLISRTVDKKHLEVQPTTALYFTEGHALLLLHGIEHPEKDF